MMEPQQKRIITCRSCHTETDMGVMPLCLNCFLTAEDALKKREGGRMASYEIDMRLEKIEKVLLEMVLLITNKKMSVTKKKSGQVSKKLRTEIIQRDNYTCVNCKFKAESYETSRLHVDHIIARVNGGTNDPSNLQTLCSTCNLIKHAHDFNNLKNKNGDKDEE